MSFFAPSAGRGKGGDLGGLAGADPHCQKLATAAGAGNKTWRAYLSTAPQRPGPVPGFFFAKWGLSVVTRPAPGPARAGAKAA